MNSDELFEISRQGVAELAPRVAAMIRSIDDSMLRVPDSDWTVRELAVHLSLGFGYYAEFATGVPSPVVYQSKEQFAAVVDALHAEVSETDPGKLAAMLTDSVDRYLAEIGPRAPEQPIAFHNGLEVTLAQMTALALGEVLLHGYDLATAVREPWPIDPHLAVAVFLGHQAVRGLWVGPRAAGHSAGYRIALRGVEPVEVRFTDGAYSFTSGDGSADCTIDADPAAFLLVSSGRVSQWPLFATGLITAAGPRPDLAPSFGDLFVHP